MSEDKGKSGAASRPEGGQYKLTDDALDRILEAIGSPVATALRAERQPSAHPENSTGHRNGKIHPTASARRPTRPIRSDGDKKREDLRNDLEWAWVFFEAHRSTKAARTGQFATKMDTVNTAARKLANLLKDDEVQRVLNENPAFLISPEQLGEHLQKLAAAIVRRQRLWTDWGD